MGLGIGGAGLDPLFQRLLSPSAARSVVLKCEANNGAQCGARLSSGDALGVGVHSLTLKAIPGSLPETDKTTQHHATFRIALSQLALWPFLACLGFWEPREGLFWSSPCKR